MKKFLLPATAAFLTASVAGAATIQVSSTILVTSGTFNGQNNTYVSNGLGDGGQGESQSPIFRCENGATIQNVVIGAPGADGIHFYNGCNLRNVHWTDVGEDASTVKGAGNVTIDGGTAAHAVDKVMQINAETTYRISNFTATDFGTFVRQNGGTGFAITVYATNITLNDGDRGFRTDSTSSRFIHCNVTFNGVGTPWTVPNSSQVTQSCSGTPTPTSATPTPRGPTPTPTNVPPTPTPTATPAPGSSEGFESGLPTSAPSSATNYNLASGSWTILRGVRSTTRHGGSFGLNLQNGTSTNSYADSVTRNGIGTITFWARGSGASTLRIEKSVGGGAFTPVATQGISSSFQSYTVNVNQTGSVRIRFRNATSQAHYIDDVVFN
jgi:pectate lyase C